MAQFFIYPPVFGSFSSTNPANGINGQPIPAESTQVGGENPSGDLEPLQVDVSGNLLVAVASSVLPTGSATAANQVLEIAQLTLIEGHVATIDTNVASIDGKTVHVDTNNVTVVSSVLPTGAATSALQLSGNASLTSIDSKLNSLGQKAMAASVPVVIASDQSTVPVSVASLPLPAGAATAANQATEITALNGLNARSAGSLVPLAFDEVDLTYVTVGNGIGQIATAVYKLATVTVATLTMTYDGSDRLSTVVKS